MPSTPVLTAKKDQLATACRTRAEAWEGINAEWSAQMDLLGDQIGAALTYADLEAALRRYFALNLPVAEWRGVLYVGGKPALPKPAWGKFVDAVNDITSIGGSKTVVGNLVSVNVGTAENPVWRSSEYMVMANFNRAIINPKTIKGWLVNIFEVAPATVTYELGSITVSERETAYADYSYNAAFVIRIAFFGLETQNTTCTSAESRVEAEAWIGQNPTLWEPLP
jgi:hypothetical protein